MIPREATALVADHAISLIRASQQRGLFVDCGSNLGQGFDFFRKFFSADFFDYELFEPNPNCYPYLSDLKNSLFDHRVEIHQAAIGIDNTPAIFYGLSAFGDGKEFSHGASLNKHHNSRENQSKDDYKILVPTINFSEFLASKRVNYNVVVIKMDIEGMECTVLEDLLNRGMFSSIHSIFCEFHSQYMTDDLRALYRRREELIVDRIRNDGCHFVPWI